MPSITLHTEINASLETCFDLSCSIDLHKLSTAQTNEEAIAGKTSGLIGLNETVTWRATHFGIRQELTSKITAYNRPYYFVDEQVKGIFKSIKHEHKFESINNKVLMTDVFHFESPLGIFGSIANYLFLTNYLKRLLLKRNETIKDFAESDKKYNLLG